MGLDESTCGHIAISFKNHFKGHMDHMTLQKITEKFKRGEVRLRGI